VDHPLGFEEVERHELRFHASEGDFLFRAKGRGWRGLLVFF
jgi:hypothetical protein